MLLNAAPGRNMLLNAAPGQNMLLNAAPGRHVVETRCLLNMLSGAIPRDSTGEVRHQRRQPEWDQSWWRARSHLSLLTPGLGTRGRERSAPGSPANSGDTVALQRHYDEWHSEMRDNCESKRFPGQNYCEIIALSIV